MRRWERLVGRTPTEERMNVIDYAELSRLGLVAPLSSMSWSNEPTESVSHEFSSYAEVLYKGNGPVAAVMGARMRLFTEARFQFRSLRDKTLFGSPALELLEQPWPTGTTGDLLARLEQTASLAGNAYAVRGYNTRAGRFVSLLRPDWVDVVTFGEPNDPDSSLGGIIYWPGGQRGSKHGREFRVGDYAHFAPVPDPSKRWVGMSWLSPVVAEVLADKQMTRYKSRFLDNSATPNFAISLKDSVSPEAFERYVAAFRSSQEGAENAGKTLFLGGGADFTVLGTDWKNLDLKNVQGGGETRIAAAGGVPPIIAGFSEGLEAVSYNSYGQARRAFADLWARPQWRNVAASLAPLVEVPVGAELWYDGSDVSFLQEDERDAAEISEQQARTIVAYVRDGFTPESAVAAVANGNLSLLQHTGLLSVQLQPPGSDMTTTAPSGG